MVAMTFHLWLAKSRAAALPMPEEHPVIKTHFFIPTLGHQHDVKFPFLQSLSSYPTFSFWEGCRVGDPE
jgi:hypothetical protein